MRTSDPAVACSRFALVLWNGVVGGAELHTLALAARMRRMDRSPTIIFVGDPNPLDRRAGDMELTHVSLGLGRGREILQHPRSFAEAVTAAGPDGALLVSRGFMSAALRIGGYRGAIVAVEHGDMFPHVRVRNRRGMAVDGISRFAGARAADAEVAVSDYMLEQMLRRSHARRTERIYNGIDPDRFSGNDGHRKADADTFVIGFAGRLAPGKGVEQLIRASAQIMTQIPARLVLAGTGAHLERLATLARATRMADRIVFMGVVDDVARFWRACDVSAVPAEEVESFSMSALEAMASGKPVVATRVGGIPEVVRDGQTGLLVEPGDVSGLAKALLRYGLDRELRENHGSAARARAREHFHIQATAERYVALLDRLAAQHT